MLGSRLNNFGKMLRRSAGHVFSAQLATRGPDNQILSTVRHGRFFGTTGRFCLFEQNRQKSMNDGSSGENKTGEASEKRSGQPDAILGEDELKVLVELRQENETLREEKKNWDKNQKELEDKYKRSSAEIENVRSRMLRQIDEAKIFSIQGFSKDLLEIPDILDLAKDSVPLETFEKSKNGDHSEMVKLFKQFYDGVLMTQTNLHKIFQKHGLVQINPLGEKFDPNIHEAVFELADDKKIPGTVGVVVKPGYLLHNRPIRAAKVGIVKGKS